MKLFNSHMHTLCSHDGHFSAEEMANGALARGLSGITITDHCDISRFISDNTYSKIKKSVADTLFVRDKFSGRLDVGVGVEIGEMIWNKAYARQILELSDFDAVLASVHVLKASKYSGGYLSHMDFSKLKEAEVNAVFEKYYFDVLKTATECDFDILAHLTLPQRYLFFHCKTTLRSEKHDKIIDRILETLIERQKALEVNTSEVFGVGFMPDERILVRYRELGGRLVTLGSDAHIPEKTALGLSEGAALLKKCGFESYAFYKKRQPNFVKIEL